MAFKIRLQPSGREFTAEKNETILAAALRSGVALDYSCNTGACGGCGGRIVAGQVRETQHHDFNFSAERKAGGYVLLCSSAAESDMEIEVREAGGAEDIPFQRIATRVERLERIQDDILILHLRTPRSQTLRFLAGQHVSLSVEGVTSRSKSIASCPCNAMQLQFHIRHVAVDPFSEYVFTRMKPAQTIMIEGPSGDFTLDEASRRPILFVAYETGFAPIKSIIEHAIALEMEQPIHLYWMAHRPGDHYLQNLCRSWLDALDNFSFTPLAGEPLTGKNSWEATSDPTADARDMAILGAAIARDYPDLSGYDVYLTAPESALEAIGAQLLQQGLPPRQLHRDSMKRF